jgi:hypothetical protein
VLAAVTTNVAAIIKFFIVICISGYYLYNVFCKA